MILLDKYRELYSIIVYICIKKSQFLNELYLKVIEFRHINLHRFFPFRLINQRSPPQNKTFAPTNRIFVSVFGESKQNIRLNMKRNMTAAETINFTICSIICRIIFTFLKRLVLLIVYLQSYSFL